MHKHEPRQVAMCLFGVSLQNKCAKVAAYNTLMAQIGQVKGGEYSHPERVAEWRTTALTKCMLSKVVDGAEVNEATLNACEQSVNFAYDVGTLDRKSEAFAELTAAYKFTCSEDNIKFRGETWEVPQGEAPASSEYTTKSFLPEVSLAKGNTPIVFCKAGGGDGSSKDKGCNEALVGDVQDGYRGCQAKTKSGKTCQKWTEQAPHGHSRTPEKYPNLGLGDHNYCRNPDHEPNGIWCYTSEKRSRWEYCSPL